MGVATIVEALIGRRCVLPAALVARFPELASVHWRRGGIPVHVAGWFLRQRSAAAVTLWRAVFLDPQVGLDAELLLHELRHVRQFEANPAFPVLYLWESLRRGYFDNRFEADAREYAARRLRPD
jgi:Domain of unknown function (DUF4157)